MLIGTQPLERNHIMKATILTALAAVVLGTSAYAGVTDNTLSSRAPSGDVAVFERDKGIYGTSTIRVNNGVASYVDADKVLLPLEQAIATNGQVLVYSFSGRDRNDGQSFPRR